MDEGQNCCIESPMFGIIIITVLVLVIAIIYYCFRDDGPSHSNTPEEISEYNSDFIGETSTGVKKSEGNVLKNLYSNIVRKKSASLTELPKLVQRRHSTVGTDFPQQVARAAKAAKNFIPDLYRRQLSMGGTRQALPKPPSEFFEPLEIQEIPEHHKPITYIRRNTKFLDLPSYCEIKEKDIRVITVDTNTFLAEPGDPDDSIYVVLEGCLSVYITPPDGKTSMVRRIVTGECFFSSLSLLDIFMGKTSILKTVSLKAAIKTKVAKYSIEHFYHSYLNAEDKSGWVRSVQIIATRLLHVVLTTLHQHLGLGEELMNKRLTSMARSKGVHRGQSLRATNRLKPKLKRMQTELENTNNEQKISIGVQYFREALQLSVEEAEKLLRSCIKIVQLDENQTLFDEHNSEVTALGIVISGVLKLTQSSPFSDNFEFDDNEKDTWCAYIHTQELVGGLQVLTEEAFYTVKAACTTIVALIDKKDMDHLIEQKPSIVFPIAYSVLQRVSSFVRAIDFALGWTLLDSGEALYRKGDSSDSVFVVLSGRLRSVSNKMMVEEFGKGDAPIGIIEVLQQNPRATTVLAVRYSQLAEVPEGMLNFVKMQFPQVGFRLVRLLGQYYSGRLSPSHIPHNIPDPMTQRNLHTIAIFPATLDVPVVAFTCELYHALSVTTRVLRLSSRSVVERLGEAAVLERKADFRLMHWLNSQEDIYHLVLYECDYTTTNWTRRCLSQADAIIVVAYGDQKPPEKHFIDQNLKMNQDGIRSRKELVLLWRGESPNPKGTYEWLKGSWFSGHYHIRAPDRMFAWESKVDKNENEILEYYRKNIFRTADRKPDTDAGKTDEDGMNCEIDSVFGDFARLGRILSGNAVGLVLGGGGARGAAHVGVIKALRSYGIPVDIVGGTSIGSLVGGVFAMNPFDLEKFTDRTRFWFLGMCSYWKTILDLTWAFSARFSGYNFNELLQKVFGDKNIEDLWLPYFCITTDISNSEMRVHRTGPIWRYVRASMSLAVYLPPICDSEDGHYLLDGGYVNNLPADVMRSMGARTVLAIDVSSANEKDFHNYGDYLNGFYAQFRSLMPWQRAARILTSQEIQDRLAFVSSVKQLEMVKKAPYCNYLRPPIDGFQTLDFPRFDVIQNVGFEYANENLSELIKTNNHLKTLRNHGRMLSMIHDYDYSALRAGSRSLHNSFTDLAAQISRIPTKYCRSLDDLSKVMDEEDEEEEAEREDEGSDSGGGELSAQQRDEDRPSACGGNEAVGTTISAGDGPSTEATQESTLSDEDLVTVKATFKFRLNENN